MTFTPTKFNVTVNRVNLTIDVQPNGPVHETLDANYHLRSLINSQLGAISRIDTPLYASALGDALLLNIDGVERDYLDDLPQSERPLEAIGLSFENVIDQIPVAILSAQIIKPHVQYTWGYNWTTFWASSQFYNASVVATWEVTQIGSNTFVSLAFGYYIVDDGLSSILERAACFRLYRYEECCVGYCCRW